ncbi:hypothetical protein K1T73_07730 [Roseovarius sp. SCSIO 43702]|uniref:hypothetical protein n=1 Tax=Roseovarius sp. SCSIO 43702 TaxID=2823043 RepID=UPI001C7355CC|nr:hypothetical protein [Roseovarius sp. SCSIO 43702]QYX58240.1 hypothetical protein K1T73_07730 [Roseovarius sp. SCSIO 43702]
MKPNFALSLSFDGIRLLRRAYLGWHPVGEVSLDAPDLNAALAELRAQAAKFAPRGITTKLIIPDDQIKYLDLPTDDAWAEDRAGFVRAALADATPYDISELAYDWSVDGDRVKIAAVARETLAEAESFAAEHEFGPVSFVAQPADDLFAGEPFFGETSVASEHLAPGESVERDMTRLHVIPVPTAAPEDAEPETATAAEASPSEDTATPPAPEEPVAPPATTPQKDTPAKAPTSPADDTPPAGATDDADPTPADDTPAPEPVGAALETATPPEEAAPAEPPEAPRSFDEIQSDLLSSLTPDPESGTESDEGDTTTPSPSPAASAGFTSIRARRDADAVADPPRLEGVSRLTAFGASARKAPNPVAPEASVKATPKTTETPAAAPAAPSDDTPPAPPSAFFSVRRPGAKPAAAAATPAAARPGRSSAGNGTARGRAEDEKQRMTVFGAREPEVGGKPRFLGLILTAALLLFLVAVAAWASIFLDDGLAGLLGRDDDTTIAAPKPDPDDPVTLATTEPPTPDRVVTPDLSDTGRAARDADTLPLTPTDALPAALSPDEARARYAATGIWQLSPDLPDAPATGVLGTLDTAGTDAPLSRPGPSTLPRLASLETVTRPTTPGETGTDSPAIDLEVDPGDTPDTGEALVEATPEGALTPEGIRVFAGRPEVEPPRDMTRPEAAADDETEAEAEDSAQEAEDAQAVAAAVLATPRPRLRPADLVPEATDDTDAPAVASTDSEAIAAAVAAASTADLGITDTAQPDDSAFENPTPQAVASSLAPRKRPEGFSAKVAATRKAAASRPVSTEQAVSVSVPSSASVSRTATEKNAINLREVNLIGVYGSPSNRRALVRLSNGRYKKVKVGDRLDGGRVSAIGDSELRYTKRGKNLVLRMPRG